MKTMNKTESIAQTIRKINKSIQNTKKMMIIKKKYLKLQQMMKIHDIIQPLIPAPEICSIRGRKARE
jgi:hypothetical protein